MLDRQTRDRLETELSAITTTANFKKIFKREGKTYQGSANRLYNELRDLTPQRKRELIALASLELMREYRNNNWYRDGYIFTD